MQALQNILMRAGGFRPTLYLKIEHPPYMALVIEAVPEPGPLGLPAVSVAHYGEANGDLMRDPEMCFELTKTDDGALILDPYYWRNDYVGVEQWSRNLVRGNYAVHLGLHDQHERFAVLWDKNLRVQGFEDAFTDAAILG